MQCITTTELRTKSTEMIKQLQQGSVISLIHRSKIVATVVPSQPQEPKVVTAKALRTFNKKFGFSTNTTAAQRKQRYAEHLEKRYRKSV